MRFLKADKLFDGKKILPEGSIIVLNDENAFVEIVSEKALDKNNIEYYEGIISPGFVNAHCHLELSHLKNKIPQHTGLPTFAMHVIKQRNNFTKDEILEHLQEADADMWKNGIVAVGDICNGADSFIQKKKSKLFYHSFIELIGLNPNFGKSIFDRGLELLENLKSFDLQGSLAPHAPYSTSVELIKLISNYNAAYTLPLSIHNQESEEESKFFAGTPSDFEKLYDFLKLDISWFKAPKCSSLEAYIESLSSHPSLLIHNTFSSKKDIALSQAKNIYWCFCPGANMYIENRLPDYSLFEEQKNKLCIGTDSLASNLQLDVIQEANLIWQAHPTFTLEEMLQMLTSNGAEALGISNDYGNFIPGKNAGLNLLDYHNTHLNFIRKII